MAQRMNKTFQLARAVVELKLGSSIPDEPIIYGSSSFHTMSRAHVEPIKICDLFHVLSHEILNWAHGRLNRACANLYRSARQSLNVQAIFLIDSVLLYSLQI